VPFATALADSARARVTQRARPPALREPEAAAVEEIAQELGPFEDASLGRSLARLGALVRGRITRT